MPPMARWRRDYRDALGRPMSGQAVLYPRSDGTSPAPITVDIVDGVVDAALPSGTYNVAERTVSADGVEQPFSGSYTLTI